ncbi:MAG: hypothetical protein ACPG31_11155, partial [Planctomycetota bacterium]
RSWANERVPSRDFSISSGKLTWIAQSYSNLDEDYLCWAFVVESQENGLKEKLFIKASKSNEIVLSHSERFLCSKEPAVEVVPVSGTITALTEEFPGAGSVSKEMARMRVDEIGTSNSTSSSASGFFTLNTIGSPPHLLGFRTRDDIAQFEVIDRTGSADETSIVSGTGQQVDLNQSLLENLTAKYNVFSTMQEFKLYLNNLGPGYFELDALPIIADVNRTPPFVSYGNAVYDGNLVFAASGSGFENMAFASVIVHEIGHWLYSSTWIQGTTGNNGLQEGLADAWAMYFTNDELVGRNYAGPGTFVRSGVNNSQWCRNSLGGCNANPHEDGLPLMGALWDLYNSIPPLAAEELLPAVTSSFSFGFVDTRIRDMWIACDDDNSNLADGTPHFAQIEAAFTSHGWEPFGTNAFFIEHSPLPNSIHDSSSFQVIAEVSRNPDFSFGSINSVELEFTEILSGASGSIVMSNVSGDTYSGTIPAIPSPAVIEYAILASYSAGPNAYQVSSPSDGSHTFMIGSSQPLFYTKFESTPGKDQGWTHQDNNNPSFDDWQRENPGGNQGVSFGTLWHDPPTPPTENLIWGTDIKENWDGAYRSGVDSFLESPILDATNSVGLVLNFDRWSSIALGDRLSISAVTSTGGSEILIWESTPLLIRDLSWKNMNYLLPPALNGQLFKLRFGLQSDSGNNYGGWGIDNVSVSSLEGSPAGSEPSNTLSCMGETAVSVGEIPVLDLSEGTPGVGYEIRVSPQAPTGGWQSGTHHFDLGPNFTVLGTGIFLPDGTSQFTLPQAATSNQVGATYFFEAVEMGTVIQDSNLFRIVIWP